MARNKALSDAEYPFPWHIIPEIIQYATGYKPLSCEPIQTGVMTYKILCRTKDDLKYILRVYPHGREDTLEKEIQILDRCKGLGLSVPNTIATSADGPNIGLKYFVYPRIEGMMLSTYLEKAENPRIDYIGNQLITIFSKLSLLDTKKPGELINGHEGNYTDWKTFICDSIKNGHQSFYDSGIISKEKINSIEAIIFSILNSFPDFETHLIWGDTSTDNILVEKNGKISGLIDFESCLSGPKNCTLGYFINTLKPKFKEHEALAKYLLNKSNTSNEEIYAFSLLRAYRLAQFIDKPLPTGRQRDKLIDIFPGLKWASDFFTDRQSVVQK